MPTGQAVHQLFDAYIVRSWKNMCSVSKWFLSQKTCFFWCDIFEPCAHPKCPLYAWPTWKPPKGCVALNLIVLIGFKLVYLSLMITQPNLCNLVKMLINLSVNRIQLYITVIGLNMVIRNTWHILNLGCQRMSLINIFAKNAENTIFSGRLIH